MAIRSPIFDQVDPELVRTLQAISEGYKPYEVRYISGYRPNSSLKGSEHRHGGALDIELIDRATGQALKNVRDPSTAAAYQQFANDWYRSLSPEQQARARWGGYFRSGTPFDWMHLDFGGRDRMAGGTWEGGFNEASLKDLGLTNAGGIGAVQNARFVGPAAPASVQDYSSEQRRNAIAGIESAGSGDYAARGKVVDRTGNQALGRYQIMASNLPAWSKQALGREVSVDEFMAKPELQDLIFDKVFGDYVTKYGERGAASAWFTGSPNEPEVSDIHGKLTGRGYADKYLANLGGGVPGGYTAKTGGGGGGGGGGATPASSNPYVVPKKDKAKDAWAKIGEGIGGAAGSGQPFSYNVDPTPGAAIAAEAPAPIVDPQQREMKRQQLAYLMQRLGSGSLF
jgi:hypothetical protein